MLIRNLRVRSTVGLTLHKKKNSLYDASARDVATTRGRRHHTEIANLYNTSVYLSM